MAYYLNREFKPNDVFAHLEPAAYTHVLGINVGQGGCAVWLYEYKDGAWSGKKLRLDSRGATKIPVRISFTAQRKTRIGYDADPLNFLERFEMDPSTWENNIVDGQHTNRDLMACFLEALWGAVLGLNPELLKLRPDELLLVVGRPAANKWVDTAAYQQLVQEVTGRSAIAILSEAHAAVLYAAFAHGLDLSQGIAVYDIGATTADFVYIQPGNLMISRSMDWGGDLIDFEILKEILSEHHMTTNDIPPDQFDYVLAQVRIIKEKYYGSGNTQKKDLYLLKTGDDGVTLASGEVADKRGFVQRLLSPLEKMRRSAEPYIPVPGEVERKLSVTIDRVFMQNILGKPGMLPELLGFFQNTKNRLERRPCGRVILTGGTGQISEIADIAQSVYGAGCTVSAGAEFADCVPRGLALVKGRQSWGVQTVSQHRDELEKQRNKSRYYFYDKVANVVCTWFPKEARDYLNDLQTQGRKIRVSQAVQELSAQQAGGHLTDVDKKKLKKCLEKACAEYTKTLFDDLAQTVSVLYGSPLDEPLKQLRKEAEETLTEKRNALDLDALMNGLLEQADYKKMFYYSCFHYGAIPSNRHVARAFSTPFRAAVPFSPETLKNSAAVQKYPELVEKELDENWVGRWDALGAYDTAIYYDRLDNTDPYLSRSILASLNGSSIDTSITKRYLRNFLLDAALIQNVYDELFSDLYEVILGKFLLLVYEEQADLA